MVVVELEVIDIEEQQCQAVLLECRVLPFHRKLAVETESVGKTCGMILGCQRVRFAKRRRYLLLDFVAHAQCGIDGIHDDQIDAEKELQDEKSVLVERCS